jgi:hypothetical protein
MWRPTRTTVVPGHAVHGYSINQVTGARFPSPPQYAEYQFDGFESFFEALDAVPTGSENPEIESLDFGPSQGKSSGFGFFNPVQHYKRKLDVIDGTFAFFSRESTVKWRNYNIPIKSFWDGNYCNLTLEPWRAFGPTDAPILGLSPLWMGTDSGVYSDDNGLYSVACENILPKIRPASSLINSIYELKDVKTLPHTYDAINKAINHLGQILKGEAKLLFNNKALAGRRTLKSIVNAGADVYLQSNFNIAPLLQDITNTVFSVDRVRNKLTQLIESSNRPLTSHWGARLPGFENRSDTVTTSGRPSDEDASVSITRIVSQTARFQATVEYSYRMLEGSYKDLLVRGIIDYNGLTLSPQTIWNAIPWSFVVDWIVGVGPWLSQFTGRQLDIVTHIGRAGWSVKVTRQVSLSSSLTGPVANWFEESYSRTPQSPPLIDSLRTSGINLKEFTLGSALGITHK